MSRTARERRAAPLLPRLRFRERFVGFDVAFAVALGSEEARGRAAAVSTTTIGKGPSGSLRTARSEHALAFFEGKTPRAESGWAERAGATAFAAASTARSFRRAGGSGESSTRQNLVVRALARATRRGERDDIAQTQARDAEQIEKADSRLGFWV